MSYGTQHKVFGSGGQKGNVYGKEWGEERDAEKKALEEGGYYLKGEEQNAPGAARMRTRMMEHSDKEIDAAKRYLWYAQHGDTVAQKELQQGIDQGQRNLQSQAAARGMSPSALRAARYAGDQMGAEGAVDARMLGAIEEQAAQQQYVDALQRRSNYEQFVQGMALQKAQMDLAKEARDRARAQALDEGRLNATTQGAGAALGMMGGMGSGMVASDERLKVGMVEASNKDIAELRNRLRARDDELMRRNLESRYDHLRADELGQYVDRDLDAYRTARDLRGLDRELAQENEKWFRAAVDPPSPNVEYASSLVDYGAGRETPRWMADEGAERMAMAQRGPQPPPTAAERAEPEVRRLREALAQDNRLMEQKLFGAENAASEYDELLGAMRPKTYEYQPGLGLPSGRRAGPTAQDLESSSLGNSLVMDTPQGKMVDTDAAALATMGATGRLNDRLGQQERELSELKSMLDAPPPWEREMERDEADTLRRELGGLDAETLRRLEEYSVKP